MVDFDKPWGTVPLEQFEEALQKITDLKLDAILRGESYKKSMESLESRLTEAQNSAKWTSDRVTTLEQELRRLKAENTELQTQDLKKRYNHALKLLSDILEAKTRNLEVDHALLEDVAREATEGGRQPRPQAGRRDDRYNTSSGSSWGTTTRPLPSPAPSFSQPLVISGGSATPANSSLFRSDTPPREVIVSDSDDENPNTTQRFSTHSMEGGREGNSFDDMYVDQESEEGGSSAPIGALLASVAEANYPTHHFSSSSSPATVASSEIMLRHSYLPGPRDWVYWRQPPGCAIYALGAYTLKELQNQIKLDDEKAIRGLDRFSEFGLNIAVQQLGGSLNVAFIHRPMFYDTNGQTYLVSWSENRSHNMTLEYLRRWTLKWPSIQGRRPILHILSSPDEEATPDQRGWWYFCAMKWKVVDLPSIWDTLGSDKKETLVDELSKRCPTMERKEIVEKMTSGELKQLTIEVKAVSRHHASEFAEKVLGVNNPDLLG